VRVTEHFSVGYSLIADREGRVYLVDQEGKHRIEDVDVLVVDGVGSLNSNAIAKLIERKINVIIGSRSELYQVRYNNDLREYIVKKQIEFFFDYDKRVETAKAILRASAINKIHVLKVFNTEKKYVDEIERYLDLLRHEAILDLMGVEAAITKKYYEALRTLIPSIYGFESRTRRPPRDCVSASMSLMNSWLYEVINREILKNMLDPRIGILHTPFRYRISLALDLAEEFRQAIVEMPLISVLRSRGLDVDRDFEHRGDAVYVSKRGRVKLMRLFETRLSAGTRGHSLRDLITRQVGNIVDLFLGRRKDYNPFTMR